MFLIFSFVYFIYLFMFFLYIFRLVFHFFYFFFFFFFEVMFLKSNTQLEENCVFVKEETFCFEDVHIEIILQNFLLRKSSCNDLCKICDKKCSSFFISNRNVFLNVYYFSFQVVMYVNKVGPYFNPHETYHYYSLPVCRPDKVSSVVLQFGLKKGHFKVTAKREGVPKIFDMIHSREE